MTNLTIFNDQNTQIVYLSQLTDPTGAVIPTATITGTLMRAGVALTGGSLTFTAVESSPGDYEATLSGFDAPPGAAQLLISGTNSSNTLNYGIYCTIAERSL